MFTGEIYEKIILLILDGFGIREGENGNAIKWQIYLT